MPKKLTGIMYSNDPNTILSYGILAYQIMANTAHKIDWKLISKEIQYMRPEQWDYYTRYPSGGNEEELYNDMIPELLKRFKPEFFISIGDVQNLAMLRYYIKKTTTWIHYLPIDNHDKNALDRHRWIVHQMDIPVLMSKFGRDFSINNGIPNCDHYIYPMVKSGHTKKEKDDFINREKGWMGIHLGYRKITDSEPKELADIQGFKKSLKMPKDAQVLLFIGRPGWRKNIQFLISILRKLITERERNVVLYMHSDPNDPASTVNILKELHAHQIPDDNFRRSVTLKWYQGLHVRAMNAIYNIADIQVSTHGGEGFGIPLAEGLACELPFVATDCTTTPELSGNNKWSLGAKIEANYPDRGILRPFINLDDFCDKIEYLLDHTEEKNRMGRRGRKFVEKVCSPKTITKKWLDIFDMTYINRIEVRKNRLEKAILVDIK